MNKRKYDKEAILRISQACGVSQSSVYRILLDPFDFSPDTVNAVIKAAREYGITENTDGQADRVINIGVIIPNKPQYFWKEAVRGMQECSRKWADNGTFDIVFDFKYCSFPTTAESSEALYPETKEQVCNGYILYPIGDEAFFSFLETNSRSTPVIILNDYPLAGIQNPKIAFIGADNYDEGRKAALMLGEKAKEIETAIAVISNESTQTISSHERIRGFYDALAEINPSVKTETITLDVNGKTSAAALARLLSTGDGAKTRCVYASSGFNTVVCTAVEKLKRQQSGGKIICVGHELSPSDKVYIENGILYGYVKQDIFMQGYMAADEIISNLIYKTPLSDRKFISSVFRNTGNNRKV